MRERFQDAQPLPRVVSLNTLKDNRAPQCLVAERGQRVLMTAGMAVASFFVGAGLALAMSVMYDFV